MAERLIEAVPNYSEGRDIRVVEEIASVADAIPGALFEVQEGQSHQPFQEIPDAWNARVDAFWQDVELRDTSAPRPRSAPDHERTAAPADRSTS